MLESYIHSQTVLQQAAHISSNSLRDYLKYLESKGYSSRTIQCYLCAVLHCVRWLDEAGRIEELTPDDVSFFLTRHLPRCRCPRSFQRDKKMLRAALNRWIDVICQPPQFSQALNNNEKLVSSFDQYLATVAGLSDSTRHKRCQISHSFLDWISNRSAVQLETLCANDIADYIDECASHGASQGTLAVTVCSISRFLQFLSTNGLCPTTAMAYIPRPKLIEQIPVTPALTIQESEQLLNAFDRSYPVGKRDYAMARCLSDLGVRTSDVALLSLDDIDWRHDVIHFRPGKSRRSRSLPMPESLREAFIDYLCNARPLTATRALFVYHRAPKGEAVLPSTVRCAIRRAFERAGFPASVSQVHRLRHTVATRLLEQGNSLKTIADVLGNQCLETTTRYTFVDRQGLLAIALPWPGRDE